MCIDAFRRKGYGFGVGRDGVGCVSFFIGALPCYHLPFETFVVLSSARTNQKQEAENSQRNQTKQGSTHGLNLATVGSRRNSALPRQWTCAQELELLKNDQ